MAKSRQVDDEKLARNTKQLRVLSIGTPMVLRNQSGRYPTKWDKTGVVVEVRPHEQLVFNVDRSRRLTLRNRKFVRDVDPRKTSLVDQSLDTNTDPTPVPVTRKKKTRQTASAKTPITWTLTPAPPITPPQSPAPALSPPSSPL
jgi:hypothetical protein